MRLPNIKPRGHLEPIPGGINVLLLSCMDLRLLDETVAFMDLMGLTNRYDHVILAGASLGATFAGKPHWGDTFRDHLAVARQLHDVREVLILEHRNCGAYRLLLDLDAAIAPEPEAHAHAAQAERLREQIGREASELRVRSYLMDLDGTVGELSNGGGVPLV